MNGHPRKTLADYLVIGITPLLIMVLVASVSFFLLELAYQGYYEGRMRWVMFWFTVASVLVSRISIEQGSGAAVVYGIALATVTVMAVFKFFGPAYGALGILAFIWWLTSKLTWDCTLIDDDKDASGEGLLQAANLDSRQPGVGKKKKPSGVRPHAPGMWVVYFSLLALPAFGIGQSLVPADKAEVREYCFQLLAVYVAAALALLLSTSFLGLRRYLRQRHLQMPGKVAATWLLTGSLIAVGVLGTALLVPRPDATWSVTALIDRAGEAAEEASKQALLSGEAGEGEGRQIGEGKLPEEGKVPTEQRKKGAGNEPNGDNAGEQGKAGGEQAGTSTGASDRGKDQPQIQEGAAKDVEKAGGAKMIDPMEINETASQIGWLVKLAIYALVLLGLAWLVFLQRHRLAGVWAGFRQQLAELWRRWFGKPPAPAGGPLSPPTAQPFATFINPFHTGSANTMPLAETVVYTFQALEAWAREHGNGRRPEQTPNEFALGLSLEFPDSGNELRLASRYYSGIVYADREPPEQARDGLLRVWQLLETSR